MKHLLCDGPVLQRRRLQSLVKQSFRNLEYLNDIRLMNLLRFVKNTGRFP